MFTPMFLDITDKIIFLNDFKKAFLNFERTFKERLPECYMSLIVLF